MYSVQRNGNRLAESRGKVMGMFLLVSLSRLFGYIWFEAIDKSDEMC